MTFHNRNHLFICAIVALVVSVSCSKKSSEDRGRQLVKGRPSESVKKKEQTNLFIISIDALRRDHLMAYDYPKNTSKTISKIANDGVVFDNAITAHSDTAPSNASILTGLYPGSHGVTQSGIPLKKGIPTIASILEEKGYLTAAFVSSSQMSNQTDLGRGFDVYDDNVSGDRRHGQKTWQKMKKWSRKHVKGKNKPFFCFMHLSDPSFPYNPSTKYAARFLENKKAFKTSANRPGIPGAKKNLRLKPQEVKEYEARYDGEIFYADKIVKKVFSELKNIKARNKTLLVILSAHGETLFERGWVADHGGRVYDEQIRVPLIIRFPDEWKRGTRIKEQVQLVDVLPTILEYLKIDTQIETEGWSLLPLINGTKQETTDRAAFSHAITVPARLPEIRAPLIAKGLISSIRYPGIKLIEYPLKDGKWYQQLFDLSKDPGETKDIAAKMPDRVKELHEELDRWRMTTDVANPTDPEQPKNKNEKKP